MYRGHWRISRKIKQIQRYGYAGAREVGKIMTEVEICRGSFTGIDRIIEFPPSAAEASMDSDLKPALPLLVLFAMMMKL